MVLAIGQAWWLLCTAARNCQVLEGFSRQEQSMQFANTVQNTLCFLQTSQHAGFNESAKRQRGAECKAEITTTSMLSEQGHTWPAVAFSPVPPEGLNATNSRHREKLFPVPHLVFEPCDAEREQPSPSHPSQRCNISSSVRIHCLNHMLLLSFRSMS